MSVARRCAAIASALALLLCAERGVQAQAVRTPTTTRLLDSRSTLQAAAQSADSMGKKAEAAQIRARITKGDFAEGDRIILRAPGLNTTVGAANAVPGGGAPPGAADTLFVQPNGSVVFARLPNVPPLSLVGVLRSELNDRVRRHIFAVLADTTTAAGVTAYPLVMLSIRGSVGRSGYMYVTPQGKLSDLITLANGYGSDANPDKIVVRRGTDVLLHESEVRAALTGGVSINDLSLKDGDDVVVPRKTTRSWMTLVQFALGFTNLIVSLTR